MPGAIADKLSIIGLGKPQLPLAACLAHKGYTTIGVDLNPDIIQAVNKGECPIHEPGVGELINSSQERLSATSDYRYAIENSDITFIVVSTPSREDGSLSTRYVEDASKSIAEALKYSDSALECLKGTEFCILATPWDEFKGLKAEDFTKTMKNPVLLDRWRILDRSELSNKLEYMAVGLRPGR